MQALRKTALAIAAASTLVIALPASAEAIDPDKFVKMCDANKDGTVSKAEVMKMVEQMFDKSDTKRTGKLDRKQVEHFLQQFVHAQSGA